MFLKPGITLSVPYHYIVVIRLASDHYLNIIALSLFIVSLA